MISYSYDRDGDMSHVHSATDLRATRAPRRPPCSPGVGNRSVTLMLGLSEE